MKTHYYSVTCVCGHVRRNNSICIDFPIKTATAKEASAIARRKPRVKHDYKWAIKECREVGYEEFLVLVAKNKDDPYLHCHSVQEQRCHPEIMERVILGAKKNKPHHDKSLIMFRRKREMEYEASLSKSYVDECFEIME